MLNTDHKVLASVLASHLSGVVPSLIRTTQVYGVRGRSILDTIWDVWGAVWFMEMEATPGYLVKLDFAKDFDWVKHPYLLLVPEVFCFGPCFLAWIHLFASPPCLLSLTVAL